MQNDQLFIAAAGNDGNNNDNTYDQPCTIPSANVICVASLTKYDSMSSFSNYGYSTVDVGAPGSQILSTTPGNMYESLSGTSMATPHVSGVAALLKAFRPQMTWQDIKSVIYQTVVPIPALSGKVSTGGRVNAELALIKANELFPVNGNPITPPSPPTTTTTTTTTPEPPKAPVNKARDLSLSSDTNMNKYQLSTRLSFKPPTQGESGITHYNIYASSHYNVGWWGDKKYMGKVDGASAFATATKNSGALPLSSKPTCSSGNACSVISIVKKSSGNAYRIERGDYERNENAVLNIQGPATIKFAFVSIEEYYDYLKFKSWDGKEIALIDGYSVPNDISLPSGLNKVEWKSDYVVQKSGFTFDVIYPESSNPGNPPSNPGSYYYDVVNFNLENNKYKYLAVVASNNNLEASFDDSPKVEIDDKFIVTTTSTTTTTTSAPVEQDPPSSCWWCWWTWFSAANANGANGMNGGMMNGGMNGDMMNKMNGNVEEATMTYTLKFSNDNQGQTQNNSEQNN